MKAGVNYFAAPGIPKIMKSNNDYEDIINFIKERTGIDPRNKSRERFKKEVRHLAIYIIYKYTKKSNSEVGSIFGQDHATVIHARKTVRNALIYDIEFVENYSIIIRHYNLLSDVEQKVHMKKWAKYLLKED